MSKHSRRIAWAAALALPLALTGLSPQVWADDTTSTRQYTKLDQSAFTVLSADSEELVGEGSNGSKDLVIDGDTATYWHTKWQGGSGADGKDPLPHTITIKLGDAPVQLGKIEMTPRQSSNGSGRAGDVSVLTSANCADGSYTQAGSASFPATQSYTQAQVVELNSIVSAQCVQVVYNSSWGGDNSAEQVATMAEFNAYSAVESSEAPADDPVVPDAEIPADQLLTLTDGDLSVTMKKDFPQVTAWTLAGATQLGSVNDSPTTIKVDGADQKVTVTPGEVSATSASWNFVLPDLDNVSFTATAKVENGMWQLTLSNLKDDQHKLHRVELDKLALVTLKASDNNAALASTTMSVNRSKSGDVFETVASAPTSKTYSWLTVPSTDALAFGMDSNAIEDNLIKNARGENARWARQKVGSGNNAKIEVSAGMFTWRGSSATDAIGNDEDPYIRVKPIADANSDGSVNWQDGAIAQRDIMDKAPGYEDVKNQVIAHIPFNIVSQATHPFLRTLDDTKRIALATDNLGQKVLLKGYQAEGHDSAHPDYGGDYNTGAGGLEDLKTLVNEGAKWNATFGVHVNATESYSESQNFSEDLINMPPSPGWGWMNQSYYINYAKDLGTGNIIKRFQQLRNEVPTNLNWIYLDVYYNDGWVPARLGAELEKQGWVVGSEWADKFPERNVWSHWANDESYGGSSNKGINSKVFRFMTNSYRDTFNPDPLLSNANIVEFEGWTGHNDYNAFIKNVWERNLPTKFMQRADIMKWDDTSVTLADGTTATSTVTSVSGTEIPTNREITTDGATVYTGGKYLLPWKNGGEDRLYHWNPDGGSSTWTLTKSWQSQTSLTLFRLTDTGREKVADLAVTNGKVTIPDTEAGVAYVLYPTSKVPKAQSPDWGQGSNISDPGFFSGTLDAYTASSNVKITKTAKQNFQAEMGSGKAELSQALAGGKLPAGTYNASAWIEIDPSSSRTVTMSVSGDGVTPAGLQPVVAGVPTTTFSSTPVMNSTGSDEKYGTYFQRARVTFTTTGGKVTFKIAAADGDAKVSIDDLRLVNYVPATVPESSTANATTIVYEDFENPDTGYWPFVTGTANGSGDARTQIAYLHAPYSQKGWYGKDTSGNVVEGGKLIDNVLSGQKSLLAHEESDGLILQTTPQTVPMLSGHTYKVSFDYQNARAGAYSVVSGYNQWNGKSNSLTVKNTQALPATTQTEHFSTDIDAACGTYSLGIQKSGGGYQADLSIDNFRVEDLGESQTATACADLSISNTTLQANRGVPVTTTVTSHEEDTVTGVTQTLQVPDGWQVSLQEAGATTLKPGETSTATWIVTAPDSATEGELTLNATYKTADGQTRTPSTTQTLSVMHDALKNGENYLSDLPFASTPTNGWGPVERDMSNGEKNQGDGTPITIAGTTYAKGLGAHAPSKIVYNLDGKCTSFSAVVGVDDVQTNGSVTFSVQDGNGKVLAATDGVVTGSDAGVTLTADLTGVDQLVLVVGDGGNGNGNDHADWADAKIVCTVEDAAAQPPTLSAPEDPVKPGASVELSYSGFLTGEDATDLEIVNADTGAVLATVPAAKITDKGTVTITVPDDYSSEALRVMARQADTQTDTYLTASTSVTVTQAETPDTEEPTPAPSTPAEPEPGTPTTQPTPAPSTPAEPEPGTPTTQPTPDQGSGTATPQPSASATTATPSAAAGAGSTTTPASPQQPSANTPAAPTSQASANRNPVSQVAATLAHTGAAVLPYLGVAVVLLVAGGAIILVRRRRGNGTHAR